MADKLYGIYISPFRYIAGKAVSSPISPNLHRSLSLTCNFQFCPRLEPAKNMKKIRSPHGKKLAFDGDICRHEVTNIETMSDAIDLSSDGGVIKTIVRRAKPGAIAATDNLPLLDVHYEGTLAETGEVFDTTHEDNTVFTFELGKGNVIVGWDIALRTMKVGEVAKFTIKPEYAYGKCGATLIFEIELVACRPRKGSTVNSVSDEKARLDELKKQREMAAAKKEEEKKKREEAKATAAARIQAKLESKKGQGKGKGKAK
ncbi:FKBP-like peptidyl-prolyl cis-trans isomerase family protein [Actinidia rufa]|uniref:peptidylprolyl isomerase n=1 Tax=Actinidia rufa TaxID=165716 RepID=A0A7J0GVP8_9ERIC|nr:FKBP-like peptidyl-prolyl cis-trans isomerase family protein [Actinidia rufa]